MPLTPQSSPLLPAARPARGTARLGPSTVFVGGFLAGLCWFVAALFWLDAEAASRGATVGSAVWLLGQVLILAATGVAASAVACPRRR